MPSHCSVRACSDRLKQLLLPSFSFRFTNYSTSNAMSSTRSISTSSAATDHGTGPLLQSTAIMEPFNGARYNLIAFHLHTLKTFLDDLAVSHRDDNISEITLTVLRERQYFEILHAVSTFFEHTRAMYECAGTLATAEQLAAASRAAASSSAADPPTGGSIPEESTALASVPEEQPPPPPISPPPPRPYEPRPQRLFIDDMRVAHISRSCAAAAQIRHDQFPCDNCLAHVSTEEWCRMHKSVRYVEDMKHYHTFYGCRMLRGDEADCATLCTECSNSSR